MHYKIIKINTSLYLMAFLISQLFSLSAHAQQQLNYHFFANLDFTKTTFSVHGKLQFLTDDASADSIEVVLNKTEDAPYFKLSGVQGRSTSHVKPSGSVAYVFKYTKARINTPVTLEYRYERGNKPTSQYYLDSTFCMAGGYGSAWYPQVITPQPGSDGNTTRGTGTITVTTNNSFMAVMASATVKATVSGNQNQYEFNYARPDIFSMYTGRYTRHEFKGTIPFVAYVIGKGINGDVLSEKASSVLAYLSTQFGPLDIPNFSIIELPQNIVEKTNIGGASLLGGVVIPTDGLRQFNYALFGHEMGHQWWGNKVRVKGQQGDALLSEGLAQYGSLQVVTKFDSLHAMAYRKTGYPGYLSDQCGLGYLKNLVAGNDEPIKLLTGINSHMLGDSKGFLVLDLLAQTMGRAKFNEALRTICTQYSKNGVSWEDFLAEMNKENGKDLGWFYKQWFDRKGAPAWQTNWTQNGQNVNVAITQKDSVYRLPLEIMITYTNGETSMQHADVTGRVSEFTFPASAKIRNVKVDPFFRVIHWDDSLALVAADLGKSQKVLKMIYEQKFDEAESLALSYLKADTVLDKYGLSFLLNTYLARIKGVQNKNDEALAYLQQAVQCVSRPPDLLAKTYYKMVVLALLKKDKPLAQLAATNAILADALNNNMDGMLIKVKILDLNN